MLFKLLTVPWFIPHLSSNQGTIAHYLFDPRCSCPACRPVRCASLGGENRPLAGLSVSPCGWSAESGAEHHAGEPEEQEAHRLGSWYLVPARLRDWSTCAEHPYYNKNGRKVLERVGESGTLSSMGQIRSLQFFGKTFGCLCSGKCKIAPCLANHR